MEGPFRFNNRLSVSVPTTDWRDHPDTDVGEYHIYGSGIVHHDLINTPFHGYMYDTAIIAHPLSTSDCLADPRVKVAHIQHIMCQLRHIQWQSRRCRMTTTAELRARQNSIDVLKGLREKALERFWDRYFARLESEGLLLELSENDTGEVVTDSKTNGDQGSGRLRRDSVVSREEK